MPRRRGTISSKGFQAVQQAEEPLLWVEAVRLSRGLSAGMSALMDSVRHIFSKNKRQG